VSQLRSFRLRNKSPFIPRKCRGIRSKSSHKGELTSLQIFSDLLNYGEDIFGFECEQSYQHQRHVLRMTYNQCSWVVFKLVNNVAAAHPVKHWGHRFEFGSGNWYFASFVLSCDDRACIGPIIHLRNGWVIVCHFEAGWGYFEVIAGRSASRKKKSVLHFNLKLKVKLSLLNLEARHEELYTACFSATPWRHIGGVEI
jgi:hypothetical protein